MTEADTHAQRLRRWADVLNIPSGPFVNDDLRSAADYITAQEAEITGLRIELKAAKMFGGGFFADVVLESTRDHYRARASTEKEPG